MAATVILNFHKYAFPTTSICSKSKSQCFHKFWWRSVKYSGNGSSVSKSILKTTLPIKPSLREMNSLFITFNQKCNFYWGILTFKGSLVSGALMLKRFFARNRPVQTFTGQNVVVFRTVDHLEVNLKAPNPQKARFSIGTRLLSL